MTGPKVSCVMVTRNRAGFVPQAIQNFQRQTYENRELLIIDDGNCLVSHLIPVDKNILYFPLSKEKSIGSKRNMGTQLANGEYVTHWDDDDYQAPIRIEAQMRALLSQPERVVCGVKYPLFFDLDTKKGYYYDIGHKGFWISGSTLLYQKQFALRQPFEDISMSEDQHWVFALNPRDCVMMLDGTFNVAYAHPLNTCIKDFQGEGKENFKPCVVSVPSDADAGLYQRCLR